MRMDSRCRRFATASSARIIKYGIGTLIDWHQIGFWNEWGKLPACLLIQYAQPRYYHIVDVYIDSSHHPANFDGFCHFKSTTEPGKASDCSTAHTAWQKMQNLISGERGEWRSIPFAQNTM